MKTSFRLTFDDQGKSRFLDKADKATFESLLLAIRKSFIDRGKKPIYEMTISTVEKTITDKQISLWKMLLTIIADNSGHSLQEIEETILNENSISVNEFEKLNNEDFQNLLLKTTKFSSEFFGINITLKDDKFIKTNT